MTRKIRRLYYHTVDFIKYFLSVIFLVGFCVLALGAAIGVESWLR